MLKGRSVCVQLWPDVCVCVCVPSSSVCLTAPITASDAWEVEEMQRRRTDTCHLHTSSLALISPLSLSFSAGKSNIGQRDASVRPSVRPQAALVWWLSFFPSSSHTLVWCCQNEAWRTFQSHTTLVRLLPLSSPDVFTSQIRQKEKNHRVMYLAHFLFLFFVVNKRIIKWFSGKRDLEENCVEKGKSSVFDLEHWLRNVF